MTYLIAYLPRLPLDRISLLALPFIPFGHFTLHCLLPSEVEYLWLLIPSSKVARPPLKKQQHKNQDCTKLVIYCTSYWSPQKSCASSTKITIVNITLHLIVYFWGLLQIPWNCVTARGWRWGRARAISINIEACLCTTSQQCRGAKRGASWSIHELAGADLWAIVFQCSGFNCTMQNNDGPPKKGLIEKGALSLQKFKSYPYEVFIVRDYYSLISS